MKKKLLSFRWFKFELKRITIAPKSDKTKKFTNAKLVIEKSKQNNLIENNKIIWNCSKGVYNIIFNNLDLFGWETINRYTLLRHEVVSFEKKFLNN